MRINWFRITHKNAYKQRIFRIVFLSTNFLSEMRTLIDKVPRGGVISTSRKSGGIVWFRFKESTSSGQGNPQTPIFLIGKGGARNLWI